MSDKIVATRPADTEPIRQDGYAVGMKIVADMLAGMLVYGGLGWVGDHFLGTKFLMAIGLVLGLALGTYVVVKRFGRQ